MKQVLLVFLGGGIGSCLRYVISKSLNETFANFFLGTFLVNITGCLLIGLILGYSIKSSWMTENHTLLLATGFCGGFTTFSAFAYEKYSLLSLGEFLHLSVYTISSILLGILAVFLGLWLAKMI